MAKSSRREARQAKRKKEQMRSRVFWGGILVVVVVIIGYIGWGVIRPRVGEAIPIMPNSGDHIDPNTPPEYNSNPPTSGPHAANSLPADFYEEFDLANLPPNPEVYLIHNMEHGHIIFWYNCNILDEAGCTTLKSQIREVMDEYNGFKVVAFPWDSLDEPMVMTSWGQMERFSTFDADRASVFIETNRNRSPEPNAP